MRNQIDYITCVGHENISTLKFEGKDDDPLRSRIDTRGYIQQSGDLAATIIEGIEVTSEMILEASSSDSDTKASDYSATTKATIESLINVTPLKKNSTIIITAHIKNIYYALMPALVDLVNMADGYYVYGDKYSDVPATLQFTMNNRTYDEGSTLDGTISTTISTFGTLSDRDSTDGYDESTYVMIDLLFMQIDEDQTEVSREMNITSYVKHELQSDGSYIIYIDIEIEEPLPVVDPAESSGDSGFGSSVDDWGDVQDIPII